MVALRVLVVDDEPGMRTGASRVLERFTVPLPELATELSFEVEQAESGEEGLARIAQRPPDVLLLDHKLPGLSGLEVLDRIAAGQHDVLTVMITAYATLETAVAATKRGAFDFLAKPFTPDELRATVAKAARHLAMQRRARASEEEKRRIRFEFVRVLGHELKAPLAAVEGYLLAIREKTLGEELSAYDVMIERSLVRLSGMRKLIVDLLDMTRLESGQKRRELEPLDVREIARAALETVRAEAERRRISVTLHGEGAVPFTGDRGELELVMNNLVTNAVKYNRDEGKVEIWLELSGGTLRLRVADTGIGLTPEDQARLFQDFVRIKNEKTRAIGGSGLGLSTVKKVAQLYGGDATVRSEFGVGSTFEVTLAEQHPEPPAA